MTTTQTVTEMIVVALRPSPPSARSPDRGATIVQYHRHRLLVVTAGKIQDPLPIRETKITECLRRLCTKTVDQLIDKDSFPTLITMLDDGDPQVRVEALHARV